MRKGQLFSAGALLAVSAGAASVALADEGTAGNSAELEEIVITAQKRPEKLQDVPVAAAVVSAQALASSVA
jgi:iron complex outermembrane recepter protein